MTTELATEQPEENNHNSGWKMRVFEKRTKMKITLISVTLVTIAFYVVIFGHYGFDCFIYYSAFISILVGALNVADVLNTYSQSKFKPEAKP